MNKNYLETLKQTELFKETDEKNYKKLIKTENIIKYQKGECIYESNSTNNKIGVLLKGEAVLKNGNDEKDTKNGIILNKFTSNDIVGMSYAFNKKKENPFSISATSNSVVLFIDDSNLKDLFKKDERILENYLGLMSSNIHHLGKKIEGFTAKSAEEKLAVYLLNHMTEEKISKDKVSYKVTLDYSISKLATSLDLGRASLYRAIDTLEDNYIIIRNKKDIKIIDINKLKKLCNK